MPGSSELSDALNPYYFQDAHLAQTNTSPNFDQHTTIPVSSPSIVPQHHRPILQPHRSELEDAINPAALSPSVSARAAALRPTKQIPGDALQLLKGLIQSIASYKAAVEQEKKRRLVWEQEQETKQIHRQAELEKRVADLQRELDALKAERNLPNSSSPARISDDNAALESSSSVVPGESVVLFDPRASGPELPEFVEGSSSSTLPTSESQPSSGSPISPSRNASPKLLNIRSVRAQTIQAAMRNHILTCMGLESDRELPPSHKDEYLLRPTDQVRFVWDKTTKKSQHNASMKSRIINDIIANKELYPLVPTKDFTISKLDSVFEQSFMTFRQKYAAQRGNKSYGQDRAENKARKARRLSRKKIKLANRVATRSKMERYNVPEFDCAFHLECMSSEESSEEETEVVGSSATTEKPSFGYLRIRVLAWRSSRLQELYRAVDEHEQLTRESKPKRGVGRKDRHLGAPKDGNPPPPIGTPRWMVSKRWLRQACAVNPQIADLIKQESETTITNLLPILGDESDNEQEIQPPAAPPPAPPLPTPPQSHPPPNDSITQPQPDFAQMPVPDYSMIAPMMPMQMGPEAYQQAQYDLYAQQATWMDPMVDYMNMDLSQFSSPLVQQYPPPIQQQQHSHQPQ